MTEQTGAGAMSDARKMILTNEQIDRVPGDEVQKLRRSHLAANQRIEELERQLRGVRDAVLSETSTIRMSADEDLDIQTVADNLEAILEEDPLPTEEDMTADKIERGE